MTSKHSNGIDPDSVSPQLIDVQSRLADALRDIRDVKDICKTPSISYGVLHEGQIVCRESVGMRDVKGRREADSNTSYLVGSCAKMITSMALGILVASEKLSLTDPISKYLPEFNPSEDPAISEAVTIIDACRRSTGLANPNAVFLGPRGTFVISGEDFMDMINALPTSNHSGQRFGSWWYYSNAAFGLVGLIIERVTGTSFADFLQNAMLGPLGLKQTLVSEYAVKQNDNVAYPYAMKDGKWTKIAVGVTSEKHTPTLASMGIRSSVNDLLTFCAAVLNRHDVEKGLEHPQKLLSLNGTRISQDNPLGRVSELWNSWWTRPMDDGYENDTAHCLGWYRTAMPTAALGLSSYNFHRYEDPEQGFKKYIIGTGEGEPRRVVYGHNGITNGSVATVYLIPESHSAVVALSNAANAGDASEVTAQILPQKLFDLIPSITDARNRCLKAHDDMVANWKKSYAKSNFTAELGELVGTYTGLGSSQTIFCAVANMVF